jgi:hypothetical protein
MRQRWLLLLAIAFASCLPGCSDEGLPLAKVSGKVTFDGQPVAGASVVFRPDAGPSAVGETDAHGQFALMTRAPGDGAVVGHHTVTISAPTRGLSLTVGQPAAAVPPPSLALPARYERPESSGLSADVAESGNDFTFALVP